MRGGGGFVPIRFITTKRWIAALKRGKILYDDVFLDLALSTGKLVEDCVYDGDAEAFFAAATGWAGAAALTEKISGMVPKSLFSHSGRYLIYSYIRCAKPQLGLEIGTYHAGTALAMTHGMSVNGTGMLITIDPFGGERVPPIIQEWPPHIASKVAYLPMSSMNTFMLAEQRNWKFDFVLVDGDHSFEFALFDMIGSARMMVPGGVMSIDNADQAGVWGALDVFMANYPAWRPIGAARSRSKGEKPGWDYSFPGWSGVILQAPTGVAIGAVAYSLLKHSNLTTVSGVALDITEASGNGTLHAIVYLRAFFEIEPFPAELVGQASIAITAGTMGPQTIELPVPLSLEIIPDERVRMVEVLLVWRPDDKTTASSVRLSAEPQAY